VLQQRILLVLQRQRGDASPLPNHRRPPTAAMAIHLCRALDTPQGLEGWKAMCSALEQQQQQQQQHESARVSR
jgi:plasmid maintenance system antidote protein VapI